ncbi:MAG: discoidin domain-containing protein, partial [Candidatus Fimimonas sp.]
NIRFLGSNVSDIVRNYSVSMFLKAGSADADWTRFQNQTEVTLSPQASNYEDFLINLDGYVGGCYGIQLRFFCKNDLTHPTTISLGEIEFYPPSLTTSKPASASEHEDVYDLTKVNDGDPLTYFESKKGVFPAYIQIDMGNVERVKYINIHLPPLLLWETRTQEIEILGSVDGVTFKTVVAKAVYEFDPTTGNMVCLVLDVPVEMRYIKLVYTSNSTGYGAQISELYVYGE